MVNKVIVGNPRQFHHVKRSQEVNVLGYVNGRPCTVSLFDMADFQSSGL